MLWCWGGRRPWPVVRFRSGEGVAESGVGVGEFVTPGPGPVDAHDVFAGVGGKAGGDVEEPVADGFRFGSGEGPGEADELRPGEEGGSGERDGKPSFVSDVVLEREVGEAAVFPVFDAVFDSGVAAMA